MAVHCIFGTLEPPVLCRFTPTALYTLAEPGVPKSIREYAVEQAADGAEVTAGAVIEWLKAFREQVTVTPAELKKLAPKDEKPPPLFDAEKVYAAENWGLLLSLLAGDATLHLTATADIENNDRVLSGTLITDAGRKVVAGESLEVVVMGLAGVERGKVCRTCRTSKPLEAFSRRVDSTDGRNHYCLECERARVREYERAKAAARRKAATEVAGDGAKAEPEQPLAG
jgi:hypothetical protein